MIKKLGLNKIVIIYSLLVIVAVCAFATSFYFILNKTNESAISLQDDYFKPLNHLKKYQSVSNKIRENLLTFTSEVLPGPSVASRSLELLPKLENEFVSFTKLYKAKTPEEEKFLNGFKKQHTSFVKLIKRAAELANKHDSDSVLEILEDDWIDYVINLFKPLEKTLVALDKDYIDHNLINRSFNEKIINITIIFSIALLALITLVSFIVLRTFSRSSSETIEGFQSIIDFLTNASSELANVSTDLAGSVSGQASAIQQTSSSLHEISSMVENNTKVSVSTTQSAEQSESQAREGINSVKEAIAAIHGIKEISKVLEDQAVRGSEELSVIVTSINEIKEKTEVINDIVFQTKLLSFNASVEAARAAEHGKGFAVVAEEVGNLASMSGKSAQEIGTLLETSISKIIETIESQKQQMDNIVTRNLKSVEVGVEKVSECEVVLQSILERFTEVRSSIESVSTSSQEQSEGVSEISNALNNIDDLSHRNSSSSDLIKRKSLELVEFTNKAQAMQNSYKESIKGVK